MRPGNEYATFSRYVGENDYVVARHQGTGLEMVDCSWDGGHDWPHKDDDYFGTDVIWKFFKKNGR